MASPREIAQDNASSYILIEAAPHRNARTSYTRSIDYIIGPLSFWPLTQGYEYEQNQLLEFAARVRSIRYFEIQMSIIFKKNNNLDIEIVASCDSQFCIYSKACVFLL